MSKKRLKLLHIFIIFIIVSWTCKSFDGGRRSTWNYVNSPFNELLPRCLPEIPRLTGLKLSGEGYANLLMVFEFIHNFGETLSFGKSNKFFNKIYYSKKLSLCHKLIFSNRITKFQPIVVFQVSTIRLQRLEYLNLWLRLNSLIFWFLNHFYVPSEEMFLTKKVAYLAFLFKFLKWLWG